MDIEREKSLKNLLDQHHKWPDKFVFKFIFKADDEIESNLKALFPTESEFTLKSSTKNNFCSLTVKHLSQNAEEVLMIYKNAASIEGVISL